STHAVTTTSVHLGDGGDLLTLGGSGSGLGAFEGLLYIDGGEGTDRFRAVDADDSANNAGALGTTRLTGLGMGSADQTEINENRGVDYRGFEALDLQLGGGNDMLAITGILQATTVDTGAGNDRIAAGGTGVGDSLSDIAASLRLSGGGQADDRLQLASGVQSFLALDRGADGHGKVTGFGGDVDFTGFSMLEVFLGDSGDTVQVHDTATMTALYLGDGGDQLEIDNNRHVLTAELGKGTDTATIRNAGAEIAVSNLAQDEDGDTLIIDLSATTAQGNGTLGGAGHAGVLSGMTLGAIGFEGIGQLQVKLGSGNDRLAIDHNMDNTTVAVGGGAGDDHFTVLTLGSKITSLTGDTGEDTVTVRIDDAPSVPDQFASLRLGVEELVIDNSLNATAVHWTVTDGAAVEADAGSGRLYVLSAEGAQHIRILGGSADDALDVVSSIGSDVQGQVDGNRVELTAGQVVLVPVTAQTQANFDTAMDFDGLTGGSSTRYWEDGFSLVSNAAIGQDSQVSPAARGAGTGNTFRLFRDADNDGVSDGVFALGAMSLASYTGNAHSVTFSATTANGSSVSQTFTASGTDPATGKPVFQRFVFDPVKFAAVTEVRWTGGTALMDTIELASTTYYGAAGASPVSVETVTLSGSLLFDTSNARIISDNNRNRQLDNYEVVYYGNASTYYYYLNGNYLPLSNPGVRFTATQSGGVTSFQFAGNLNVSGNTYVSAIGGNGLSIQVANDVTISSAAYFNFSATGRTSGAGGGTGGTGGLGGSGGDGGTGGNG
ncbi:MAG: hypothetical protein KDH48_26665, partial [Rhodoferax sp.]|nr:hypothetical protein [Rhodoferax sp.]